MYPGFTPRNWVQATTLPGSRPGAGAFGINVTGGNCDLGAGDESGRISMTSPTITVPANAMISPRLAFDHYMASETDWDGGNLKISVNGGAFRTVPAAAFTFNPYNRTLFTTEDGNTNPLAAQPAFSGTDDGRVFGSWGQSQINLALAGVAPGDSIRLRYDFGQDGCFGIDGWYVDDVSVYSCQIQAVPDCSTAYASPALIKQFNPVVSPK